MNDRLVHNSHTSRREVVLVTMALAVVTAVATVWWRQRSTQQLTTTRTDGTSLEQSLPVHSPRSQQVSLKTWKKFEQAAYRIRNSMAARSLTNGDKLVMYGLYKQITVGDAPSLQSILISSKSSSWNIMAEQAKHAAWSQLAGLSLEDAIDKYVTAVSYFAGSAVDGDDNNNNSVASLIRTSASTTANYNDDSDNEEAFGSDDGMDSGVGIFGPLPMSRPAVENGGLGGDDDDDADPSRGICGSSSPLEIQLLRAAGRNDVVALQKLLSTTAATATVTAAVDVNYADESGQTALHLAADKGSVECTRVLLEAGASVMAADRDGISVLQAAVIAGHVDASRLLLEHGADPDQADCDGDTPRSCAGDDGDQTMQHLFSSLETTVPLKE